MKDTLKTALVRSGTYPVASRSWIWLGPRLRRAARLLTGKDRQVIGRYLAEHSIAKLHIGSGLNNLPGWLNTDLNPSGAQAALDATRPFPFPDSRFDFVYSEHMIEHVPFANGRTMLRECCRVMKPGATLRIVTPDLAFLARLLQDPAAPAHAEYIRYSMRQYEIDGPRGSAVHVVNHFVRAWGHQFIYDEATLRAVMQESGFGDIASCRLDESTHAELAGLAKTDRMPTGLLAMESLVLEGRRP